MYLLLFPFSLLYQCLNGAIPTRKCCIKAPAKWRNTGYVSWESTPRPNRAVGSTKWTNTFDFKILKYTIRIIENATFQNIFACGFFFMAIFVYCKYKKMTWKPLISSIFAQKYNFLSWLPYPKAPFMHLAYSKQS